MNDRGKLLCYTGNNTFESKVFLIKGIPEHGKGKKK